MLSWFGRTALGAARCPSLLRSASSYRSSISLDSLYPGTSLILSTPSYNPESNEKFSGYIPINKLKITYSASSGPGGQNVNKVHTKADVRFQLSTAEWLPQDIRQKLADMQKSKLTKDGYLVLKSNVTRSQQLNVADCLQKLRALIRAAAQPEAKPSQETEERIRRRLERAARERLMVKRMDAQKRAERRPPTIHDL